MNVLGLRIISILSAALIVALSFACTKKQEAVSTAATDPKIAAEKLVERGRAIYKLNCISCHNPDPAVDGVLGPAVKGSSLELLTARLLKAKYPEGYKPKRETQSMPALPHLEAELPALHAYLTAP